MKNPLTALPQRLRTRATSPLRALVDLENEMDRWFQGSLAWPEEAQKYDFSPTCDFKESPTGYVLQLDIPGVKKNDVKIEIENNRLTVSGDRTEKKEEKDARHFFSETYYGSFMRSFNLPSAVDETKVDAHYEDGVLTVKVPKQHTTKAREVRIN